MDFKQQTKGISPILQSLLLAQLGKIAESIDIRDYGSAWQRFKTLMCIVPPVVKKECDDEVDKLIGQINLLKNRASGDTMDLYLQGFRLNRNIYRLLGNNMERIARMVADKLYQKGYLENVSETARGRELDY